MKIEDTLQETYTALSANMARSGLTVLGIVIGIASVITLVAVDKGATSVIQSSIQCLGSNLLLVSPGAAATAGGFGVSACLLYTSPSPRDRQKSRMPSS